MSIIDAHHHLWDPALRSYPWLGSGPLEPIRRPYGLDDLRAHADEVGVDRTVLVQTVSDLSETREFLTVARASRGLIAGVVGWVDLTHPEVERTLAELRASPEGALLVGIRHQVQDEADPDWLLRPDVLRGLRAVAAAGLTYDLLVFPEQLAAAATVVERVPEGRFVLDHAGKPRIRSAALEPWASDLRRLSEHRNVACKLSGLVTEADWQRWTTADLRPYADVVFDAFGPGRVMAGSDWPVCELAASYARVWDAARALIAALSVAEQRAILGGVAARFYRLG